MNKCYGFVLCLPLPFAIRKYLNMNSNVQRFDQFRCLYIFHFVFSVCECQKIFSIWNSFENFQIIRAMIHQINTHSRCNRTLIHVRNIHLHSKYFEDLCWLCVLCIKILPAAYSLNATNKNAAYKIMISAWSDFYVVLQIIRAEIHYL